MNCSSLALIKILQAWASGRLHAALIARHHYTRPSPEWTQGKSSHSLVSLAGKEIIFNYTGHAATQAYFWIGASHAGREGKGSSQVPLAGWKVGQKGQVTLTEPQFL